MYSSFEIGNIRIGAGAEPLVIPEMGINHEGSLETAKLITDAAARAGARILKHQTHVVEDEMSHAAKKVIPGNTDVSIYEVMERCALSEEEEWELKQYVRAFVRDGISASQASSPLKTTNCRGVMLRQSFFLSAT